MTEKFTDVVCTYCGSLCDDLVVKVKDNQVTDLENGCIISKNEFKSASSDLKPQVNGKEVEYQKAKKEAVNILTESRYPLIYGLSSTSNEGQRAAIKLAERVGANIDSTSSVCHGPGTLAKQHVGMVSATLGEVKNRSDLIVIWGANPLAAHLNHAKRYSFLSDGLYQDKSDKKTIVVDVRKTATAKMADQFIQVEPNSDYEVLITLKALLQGEEVEVEEVGGVKVAELKELLSQLKEADYGSLLYGMGLTMTSGKHMNPLAAVELATLLNDYTRFVVMPMRGHGNVAGSEKTLGWQTGYPFAVNLSLGYPRYNPGEFTAVDLLVRKEVDAAVIIASDPAAHLPSEAVDYLKEIPTIVLDPHHNLTTDFADVVIPTAMTGVSASGTVYRMDNVPLTAKAVLSSPWPNDEELLLQLEEGVKHAENN